VTLESDGPVLVISMDGHNTVTGSALSALLSSRASSVVLLMTTRLVNGRPQASVEFTVVVTRKLPRAPAAKVGNVHTTSGEVCARVQGGTAVSATHCIPTGSVSRIKRPTASESP